MDYKSILKYAQNVISEAENGTFTRTFNFATRQEKFRNNRKYAEGLHSVEKFKTQFSVDGDSTYLNLDWNVSTPLPKMAEVIRGQMVNQPHKLQLIPTDSTSLTMLDRERRLVKAKMLQKRMLSEMEQDGIQLKAEGIPTDDDEFEIFQSMNQKMSYSAAIESVVRGVFADNDIDAIDDKRARDLCVNKIEVVRVGVDERDVITIRYVDPENFVSSYVTRDDFADAKHMGEFIKVPIEDLRVQAKHLTEEQVFDIAKKAAGKYGNPSYPGANEKYSPDIDISAYDKHTVLVLDLEFFGETDFLFQKMEAKNGGYYFQMKPNDYEPPKNPKRKREIIKKRVKEVYQCKYVVGTDYMYDWGKRRFMVRDRINGKYSSNTRLGFISNAPDIFEMENKSKVEEMIPYADELIRIQLKLQQVIAKAAPSGYAIDIDAVIGAMGAMGIQNMKPLDARSIRDQIGDIYFRSITEDGRPITNTVPVKDLRGGLDESIDRLANAYNNTLARMKEAIGMNDAVDGSQPAKDSLVGIQKLSLAAHKNALRSLYTSYLRTKERIASHVANIAQQQIRKGINIDMYKSMIGDEAVKTIDMARLSAAEFAISIKMLPDEEERMHIEKQLEVAQASGSLSPSDVFVIRRVAKEDIDKAEQLLAIRERKRQRQKQQEAMELAKANAEAQAQAAQMSEQSKQQTVSTKLQLEMEALKLEYQLKTQFEKELEEEKRKTMALEQEYKIEIVKVAAETKNQVVQSTPREKSPSEGYDLQRDSMPEEAGKVEPSIMPSIPTGTE